MIVRKYEPSDCKYMAELFYETVHTVNAKDYTEEQLNVWATGTVDLEEWNKSFLEHYTVVAVEDEILVGFGDMDETGYLDRLYVHKDYQNRGIATRICNELEAAFKVDKFSTHASITARPFFEKRGYQVVKEQQVERSGILLTNYVMEKNMNRNKEYELLNKLYFERLSGTESELKACKMIADELQKIGLESRIEAFDVVRNTVHKVKFEVTEPYHKVYEAAAYMGCVNTEGLSAELAYFESDTPVSRKKVEGKIALVNGYLGMKTFQALCEAKAIGFITYNGDIDQNENDLDDRELRETAQEFGNMPGVNIRIHDAMELIEKQAAHVNMVIEQTMQNEKSHNLVCDIKGESDDWIICTAHYDSVPNSKGAYDNATGAVCLYSIAEELKEKKLKHNVRLVWCGSEERGLLGSKAYVKDHKDELEQVKLVVNVDMIGTILGKRIAVSTADMSLVHFVDYYAKMAGYPLESSQAVYSSDSTPFADAGVPAVTFARDSVNTAKIHCRFDVMEHLSQKILEEDTEFISNFVEAMANAYVIPVVREMPDNMKEELDKYLGRDLLKKKNDGI